MLTLKQQQFDHFADGALAAYRLELLAHCEAFAPMLWKAAGEANFRQFILTTTDEAIELGLLQRGPMRHFVELSASFGLGFRTDPQYVGLWPDDIDPAQLPMPFAQHLHGRVAAYLAACVGEHHGIAIAALRNLLSMSWEPDEPFEDWMRRRLQAAYPQKLDSLGQEGLPALIAACDLVGARARIDSARGRLLIVVLALCFGVQVLDNPLYPWVAKRLLTEEPEADRVGNTLAALKLYAEHMIAHFEQGD